MLLQVNTSREPQKQGLEPEAAVAAVRAAASLLPVRGLMCIAAAAGGLHVLVEKPLDITAARADALIEAASHHGVLLGVIFQDRLKPDVQRAKALVAGGRLGSPILATAQVKWYRPPSY
ncbi:MAG: Gfo/Idh/MocA family oxidoreductase, partial [Thermoplasmatota archaeon]